MVFSKSLEQIIKDANIALKSRKYNEAIEGYSKALEQDQGVYVEYGRGRALYREGKSTGDVRLLELAIEDFNVALEKHVFEFLGVKHRAWIYFFIGEVHKALGNKGEALECYNVAIDLAISAQDQRLFTAAMDEL